MRCLWGFLLLAVCGATYSEVQPKPQPTQTQEAAPRDQRGTDKSPITVKIVPAPNADADTAKQEKHRQEKATEDWWLTRATVLLAVVTTILAGFTAALWSATRKLVIDAQGTSKKQLRAYVAVKNIIYESSNECAFVDVKNFGKTPAKRLDFYFVIHSKNGDLRPDFKDGPTRMNFERTMLHPGENRRVRLACDIEPVDIGMIKGYVEYTDVFQDRWQIPIYYENVSFGPVPIFTIFSSNYPQEHKYTEEQYLGKDLGKH